MDEFSCTILGFFIFVIIPLFSLSEMFWNAYEDEHQKYDQKQKALNRLKMF